MYNYLYTFKEVLLDPTALYNPFGPLFNHNGSGVALNQFARIMFSEDDLPNWTKTTDTNYRYAEEIFERVCTFLQADDVYFWISKKEYDLTDQME